MCAPSLSVPLILCAKIMRILSAAPLRRWALIEWEQSVTDETSDSGLARLHSGGRAHTPPPCSVGGNVDGVSVPALREVMECGLCTCDKMGAPWVVKGTTAVVIIILTILSLKIGHGATLRHAVVNLENVYNYSCWEVEYEPSYCSMCVLHKET